MKRLMLTVAIGSALGLSGCDGDSQSDFLEEDGVPIEASDGASTRIQFDPTNGLLPLPNDLLFSGTLDGTLEIPGEESGDYLDPQIALGALDGWSTNMPINISLDLFGGKELDPTSAQAAGAVRLFEVTLGGPLSPDPANCGAYPSLSICAVGDELVNGEDFVISATGSSIAIVPIKPLKPTSGYAYVTTDLLTDVEGEPVLGSSTYDTLQLDIQLSEAQAGLKALLDNYNDSLAAAHSLDSESVTYAGVFSTQSIQDSVSTITQLMADGLQATPTQAVSPLFAPAWTVAPTSAGYTVAQALQLTPSMETSYLLADATDVYTAELALPYYLTIPTATNPEVNSRWTALGDSPLAVLQQIDNGMVLENFAAQAIAQGIDPTMVETNPSSLVGASFTLDNGEPADALRHITRFNPVPDPCGGVDLMTCMSGGQNRVTVPVQITMPNPAKFAALGMTIEKPATGWPVAMTLHGIGGTKGTTLPLAGAYSSAGIATATIDMPLHGERGFDLTGDGNYEITATNPSFGEEFAAGNVLLFAKLDSSLTNRDNFRQAIVDHLALRLSLSAFTVAEVTAQVGAGAAPAPTFDMAKVSLQGLSLGGITGTTTTAYANSWPAELGDNPYAITNASLVAPAGGLAGSFVGSASFGPVLYATLVAELAPECIDPATGGVADSPACDAVVDQITAEVIPPFGFASQTAIDAMDPLNHAEMLAATGTPIHLIEVVGDDMQPGDLVLPNTVAGFPLSGTEPLIATMGLDAVTATTMSADGVSGAVRFTKGHHSSVASPFVPAELEGALSPEDAAAATAEMQTQIVSHAASQGAALQVTNGCVVLGGECAAE
ncbi:VolA/Pla-1 family phospholipase [Ferrimonas lipolytica]|uniref:Lipase n=1 Tax=Ferrimonas lipolytica TaxID=2724191 RepID=A0A6H1UBC0_9GAMM|nr:VolA/Pla-1 family phospholipase [Ferrimonas lipolytica]QIZ75880.1 lipase [Ferrimonas lipolytica]